MILITIQNSSNQTTSSSAGNEASITIENQSYLKFTGDIAIVLFSSNVIVPLTVGSFLLVLKSGNQQVKNI